MNTYNYSLKIFNVKKSELSECLFLILKTIGINTNFKDDYLTDIADGFTDHKFQGINCSMKYENGNVVFNFYLRYDNKIIKNIQTLTRKYNIFFVIDSYEIKNKLWQLIQSKYDEFTPSSLGPVGSLAQTTILPSKELRENIYLKIEDNFYKKIPATTIKPLPKSHIFIELYNPFSEIEEKHTQLTKVCHYYKIKLLKLGIWKEVKLWPGWRDKYKDILKEKDLI